MVKVRLNMDNRLDKRRVDAITPGDTSYFSVVTGSIGPVRDTAWLFAPVYLFFLQLVGGAVRAVGDVGKINLPRGITAEIHPRNRMLYTQESKKHGKADAQQGTRHKMTGTSGAFSAMKRL
jgi:hypothetical protein